MTYHIYSTAAGKFQVIVRQNVNSGYLPYTACMCGIVAYVGKRPAQPILVNGLKRLEYRGYDSAGLAQLSGGRLHVQKAVGKVSAMQEMLEPKESWIGIAHTRWATHGVPSTSNAHPHVDADNTLAVVHNGIVENYQELRADLRDANTAFQSETDTEVIVHLISKHLAKRPQAGLAEAVRAALRQVVGTFGIAVMSRRFPEQLVVARRGSPLAIGYGEGEYIVASDAAALVEHTTQVVYLEDDELATVTRDGVAIETLDARPVERTARTVEFEVQAVEKAGFEHFMLKEIHEQPQTMRDALRGRLKSSEDTPHLGGLNLSDDELRRIESIVLLGCGTSAYAAGVGQYWFEQLTRIPTGVAIASEWRYRDPIIDDKTLVVALSQSGETADTLAALREAKAKGAKTLGLVNVVGSSIARLVHGGVYLHAGPEIGVASTKAFTNMLTTLLLLAVKVGRLRNLAAVEGKEILTELAGIPDRLATQLAASDQIKGAAASYADVRNSLYLGRGIAYPMAMEGSHKLKEISYVHAEAYPAGEMKHGANALIDPSLLVVYLIGRNPLYDKSKSNLEEIRAREGTIVAITTEGNTELEAMTNHVLYVPRTSALLEPFVMIIPLQLFAYHMAIDRATDVDQPRNLAKSVTVE